MKSLTTFLFIFLASSTYRCKEPENTINCNDASTQMVGTWKGRMDFSGSSASGQVHNMTLSVISSNGCSFQGRCPRILGDKCRLEVPPWQVGENGNAIRCHIGIEELKNLQT